MFESKVYEVILADMLARVPNNIDKRQGSIIYDALAPAAAELTQAYIDLDIILNNAFADTAEDEYLVRKCSEIGLPKIYASKAIQKGVFTGVGDAPLDVDIGSRFTVANSQINFIVKEKIDDGEFKLECETTGTIGNTVTGQLIPISYINGLQTANLTEILILGENDETNDSLRARYFNKVQNNAQDGNIAQYIEWADEYSGIGRVRPFPLWNGDNTIKLSILNSNNDFASTELVDEFQEYLDPDSLGLGEGKAPIGSIVTVSTASGLTINISATITLNTGYEMSDAQTQAEEAIEIYLRGISYDKNNVSLIALGSEMLGTDAIASVSNLLLNSSASDVSLDIEEIPQLGTVTLS